MDSAGEYKEHSKREQFSSSLFQGNHVCLKHSFCWQIYEKYDYYYPVYHCECLLYSLNKVVNILHLNKVCEIAAPVKHSSSGRSTYFQLPVALCDSKYIYTIPELVPGLWIGNLAVALVQVRYWHLNQVLGQSYSHLMAPKVVESPHSPCYQHLSAMLLLPMSLPFVRPGCL